jgi:hypothetical protein
MLSGHVGPTLEAEGKYDDVLGTGLPTSESQIESDASADTLTVRTIHEDRQRLSARNIEPVPLKTRLPGDTSSEPHTDVGSDNATTAHARREEEEDIRPSKAS